MKVACKTCHKSFAPERAGAQYCSGRCRVAAHRKRLKPHPETRWHGRTARLAAAREELAGKLLEIANEADEGAPKTGRRFYYIALSHGYISPDMGATDAGKKSRNAAYKQVTDILGDLRMDGRLPWESVLDLTRELDQWRTYDSPREARASARRSYDEDRWLGQLYYPMVIVEKDTLEPIVRPLASRWQMPFASSRGYGSLRLQYDVAKMLRDRHARTGQRAMIFFISDHDPSGFDLERAWRDAMKNFDVPFEKIVRIGLTREQVTDPNLDIERLAIAVKPSDSRAKRYIQEHHSALCWEADILPAAVIVRALNASIEGWLDRRRWNQRDREIERARALL